MAHEQAMISLGNLKSLDNANLNFKSKNLTPFFNIFRGLFVGPLEGIIILFFGNFCWIVQYIPDMSNTTFFTPIPNIFKEALTIPNTNSNFMMST